LGCYRSHPVPSTGIATDQKTFSPILADVRPAQAPTMKDVAKRAGVSHQTVSRVLNGNASVRPKTRLKVEEAVSELAYRPSSAGRALATRRSGVLGVLSVMTPLFGPTSILFAVERAARKAGYFFSVTTVESTDPAEVARAFEHLARQEVEGIVAIAPFPRLLEDLGTRAGSIPLVAVEGADLLGLNSVSLNQAGGARDVTMHLLDQGAPQVVHVAGPPGWAETDGRIQGWRAAHRERGLDAPPLIEGDWGAASGYQAGLTLAKNSSVAAVFVANDQMALGLLRAFHEQGRRAPDDVLVAGFDDIPESAFFQPPLTTVRQDFDALGRQSIDLLLEQINDGERRASSVLIPAQLIVRRSSSLRA
jgi:DNA-binding LacI/PurR family transcriptional regulator